jgi:hypothetical protein
MDHYSILTERRKTKRKVDLVSSHSERDTEVTNDSLE